jgi:hypothetical protein
MGPKYFWFQFWYLLKKKVGIFKILFPSNPKLIELYTLEDWKKSNFQFFLKSKEELTFTKFKSEVLKKEADSILIGDYLFFSSINFSLGINYDWITNPDNGFKYDINKHWSEINDYSKNSGDIKYVWEKSRFTYLNILIRYDYHFNIDQSEFVLNEIENWIDCNPINSGPNYICSQEITIRCFNWIIALNFYKNSKNLNSNIFSKIINSIYWQADHVYRNINFSRIAVRNNHAITECLGIYTFGLFFNKNSNTLKWKVNGKKWFEEEIAYQIYNDGTFLQFSMNYQRVLSQLLIWAIEINKLNDLPFKNEVYFKAEKCFEFLLSCMNNYNGMLPNYGANDGALFFKFGVQEFRDYRPQLECLALSLGLKWELVTSEDKYWFGFGDVTKATKTLIPKSLYKFQDGGFYIINDNDGTKTFIRCGNHIHRPSQADNLHLDLWFEGDNIIRDAGSYKYNTEENDLKYFFGTKSHNTITLGNNDQMLKGERFIWYYWTQSLGSELVDTNDEFIFNGIISAFRQLGRKIVHKRQVIKKKGEPIWIITDELIHDTNLPINQYWHPSKLFFEKFEINATTNGGSTILPVIENGYYSGLYGKKENNTQIVFSTNEHKIITTIKAK